MHSLDSSQSHQRRSAALFGAFSMMLLYVVGPVVVSATYPSSSGPTAGSTTISRRPRPWGIVDDKKKPSSSRSPRPSTENKAEDGYVFINDIHVDDSIRAATKEDLSANENDLPSQPTTRDLSPSGQPPRRIIIMGGPASGKGTQCEWISQQYNVVHISTGDVLRQAVSSGTPLGVLAKRYMDTGELVPDEIMIRLVKQRLAEHDCQERGWLLDGFPRTRTQAQALLDMGIQPETFLFLNVPDEVLLERVVGRRTDPKTGKIYHLTWNPPPPDDDDVQRRLVQRSDDTVEKASSRLRRFHEHVRAVKELFEDIMVEVDGSGAPDAVAEMISSLMEERLRSA